jgi:outer membrane protein assembly factor BamB
LIAALALVLAACGAPAPSSAWPGLAANDDLAFVAFGAQVHAIDLSNGKQAWAFPAQADNNIGYFFADPGLSDDTLVVGSEGPAGSHSGVLFGLDLNGRQKWCLTFDRKGAGRLQGQCPLVKDAPPSGLFGIETPTDNRVMSGITVADGVAYFGLGSAKVFAVDIAEGRDLWSFRAEHGVWAAPLVDGERVYVASLDHKVYALRRADGSAIWEKDLGAATAGTPALADGQLFVGSFDKKLHVLDAASGDERWSADAADWVWGGPVVQEGVVYFADLSGNVYAVDVETRAQKWSRSLGGAIRAAPVIANDTLYIGSKVGERAGQFFALNLADGSPRWEPLEVSGQLLGNALPLSDGQLILAAPFQGENLLVGLDPAGLQKLAFAPSK